MHQFERAGPGRGRTASDAFETAREHRPARHTGAGPRPRDAVAQEEAHQVEGVATV